MKDLNLYTGKLNFKEINFTFAFDGEELRLIPPDEKRKTVDWDWKMKEIVPGTFVPADPIILEELFLIGECNETKRKIIFIPKQGSSLGLYNTVVRISLSAYIICTSDRDTISTMTFACPEINYIHPANQSITLTFEETQNNGIVSVSTPDHETTTTERQQFIVDEKIINAFFDVTRTISTNVANPPLRLESSLMFEFDATNDYWFVYRLWIIARNYIRFLCYRKNIYISNVKLSCKGEDGKNQPFGTMHYLGQDGESEFNALKQGRLIKQRHISGHEGEILSDIAQDNLYLRHLPDSFRAGRHFDAARFVMITAAFEWEFRRLYPNGVEKSPETIEAEKAVSNTIQSHIDETSGKQKKIYKFLKRLVKSDSLEKEIIQMGKDFSEVIGVFGTHLYRLNGQELKYDEMGKRLSAQRNHFAHGDLDEDFIGLSLLDLIFMEYVIYAMQLKFYGVADEEIRKAINELFHLNFAV